MALLTVQDLSITFRTPDGEVNAVHQLNFTLEQGETLGIVGETGAGKSQTAFALMGLLNHNSRISGRIHFSGIDLLSLSPQAFNKIRAQQIAMIFQDPMTALNPYMRVGEQLMEVLTYHQRLSRSQAFAASVAMLEAVNISEPHRRMKMFIHELSGGMRQRVMIAMALLCRPKLLIADEPTTALDVTVQKQIITLLSQLKKKLGTAIILITHDLGLVASSCDKVLVMYGGQTMESGTVEDIFYRPCHPYTIGLLNAVPRLDIADQELATILGQPPNIFQVLPGCPFQPRCPYVEPQCHIRPPLQPLSDSHLCACYQGRKLCK